MKGRSNQVVDPSLSLRSKQGKTYTVVEPLGRGGNSSAYLVIATDGPDRGMPFAAKFFLHVGTGRRTAFLNEIDYLEAHPHGAILPIYDSGTSPQGIPFYISRYMAATLEQVIENEGAPLLDKLLYSSQLASALNYLASADPPILHRDVKPENVFVNGRTCVLGDFGMMQALGRGSVDRSIALGARTPDLVRYVNGGDSPTTQSDVFSLGAVLYRLFTSEEAIVGGTKGNARVQLNTLYSVGGRFANQLDGVIKDMLADDPLARPNPPRLLDVFTGLVNDEARRRRMPRP